jgi:uncharacterized protein (TIGR02231 family)
VLSTTRPGTATAAPELNMLSVDFAPEAKPAPVPAYDPSKQAGGVWNTDPPVRVAPARVKALLVAPERVANANITAFQAIYDIGGRTTIKSTGETKRVLIASEEMDATLFIRAVPRLDQTAYLYAKLVLPRLSSPLLPGSVSLFRDGIFVGDGSLPALAPGEAYELGLGSDERVKVKQDVLEDKNSETGTFSTSRVEERSYAIDPNGTRR